MVVKRRLLRKSIEEYEKGLQEMYVRESNGDERLLWDNKPRRVWKRVWLAAPLCLFWTLWKERNRVAFENEARSAHRMKSAFLFTLWSWAKLYSVDNLNSLVGFSTWMGYR